jgi:hypothetical protein
MRSDYARISTTDQKGDSTAPEDSDDQVSACPGAIPPTF